MDSQVLAVVDDVVTSFDWSCYGSVVDVGGGTGVLATALASAYPSLHVTVVETPEVAARAVQRIRETRLAQRCDVVSGSFFDPLPAGQDVYVLSAVLHDWDDEHAARILSRCADALGPSGRVLVIGEVVENNVNNARVAAMDLRMLVLLRGMERTRQQLNEIASRVAYASRRCDSFGQVALS